MGRIFGTDGIRGVAGVDMTPELALDLGRAAATVVKERGNTQPAFSHRAGHPDLRRHAGKRHCGRTLLGGR